MPWMAIVVAAIVIVAAIQKKKQAEAAAKRKRDLLHYNAAIKDRQALAIEQDTVFNAEQHRKKAARIHAKTQLSLSASGFIADEGSPLEIQLEDVRKAEVDRQMIIRQGTIAANAARQEGELYRYQGGLAIIEGDEQGKAALVGGALSASSAFVGGGAGAAAGLGSTGATTGATGTGAVASTGASNSYNYVPTSSIYRYEGGYLGYE